MNKKEEYCKNKFPKLMQEVKENFKKNVNDFGRLGCGNIEEKIAPFEAKLKEAEKEINAIMSETLSVENAKSVVKRLDLLHHDFQIMENRFLKILPGKECIAFFVLDDIATKIQQVSNAVYSNVVYEPKVTITLNGVNYDVRSRIL